MKRMSGLAHAFVFVVEAVVAMVAVVVGEVLDLVLSVPHNVRRITVRAIR